MIWVAQHIQKFQDKLAIMVGDKATTYQDFDVEISKARTVIDRLKLKPGSVVALVCDYGPEGIAMFLALAERSAIIVPISPSSMIKYQEFIETSAAEFILKLNDNAWEPTVISNAAGHDASAHEHYGALREINEPGLVLFSSGSTGKSKAAVHNLTALMEKFKVPGKPMRAAAFLHFDHIGGFNTLFYTLTNGGGLVVLKERRPDFVLEQLAKWQVELLPTSPTFLNLLLISGCIHQYQLPSLRLITYGTEPMPQASLDAINQAFPNVEIRQTYGLSEIGILRSRSEDNKSLWMKVGGDGIETRIVDGILHVKTKSTMLGYLNAPSPITADGWFNTGDAVEQKDGYIRVLGRVSEMINVGGEKVYPTEVESVILQLDNVAEVSVYGERHPITGSIVCAKVRLREPEEFNVFRQRLRAHCMEHLQRYKVPAKLIVDDRPQFNERFKKARADIAKSASQPQKG